MDSYKEEIKTLKSTLKDFKTRVSDLTKAHKYADEQYNELIDTSANATLELISVNSKIDTRKRAFTDLKDEITTYKNEKEALIQEISSKVIEKDDLNFKIVNLKAIISDIEEDKTKLSTDYEADKTTKESELAKMELKLDDLKHLAIEQTDQIEIERKEFALWQRSLEERDKNLRIRERKLTQGEEAVLRNSDFLNL